MSDYGHTIKEFKAERKRIHADKALLDQAKDMARNNEPYLAIYQFLTVLPCSQVNASSYLKSMSKEVYSLKLSAAHEARSRNFAKVRQGAWLKMMGAPLNSIINKLKVKKSTVDKLIFRLNHVWERPAHTKRNPFAGRVKCLRCGRKFYSPDRRLIRVCSVCKQLEEPYGADAWGSGRLFV